MHFPFRVFILFGLAFLGVLYPYNRGALLASLVWIYTITSVIAGYTASSFHNQFAENGWVGDLCNSSYILMTGVFICYPCDTNNAISRNGVFVLLGFCTWARCL